MRVGRLDDLPTAGRKAQHEPEINEVVPLELICKDNGILSNGHLISGAELDDCCWASLRVHDERVADLSWWLWLDNNELRGRRRGAPETCVCSVRDGAQTKGVELLRASWFGESLRHRR